VYSYYQKQSADLSGAERELTRSFQKSFDLYHHLLLLICSLTDAGRRRLDALQHRLLPTTESLDAIMRFANNRFAEQLRTNETIEKFVNRNGILWTGDDDTFVRNLLNTILNSELYKAYLETPDTYDSDREFWRKTFKSFILENADLLDILEEKEIYWADDLDIISTFVLKTIKHFDPLEGRKQELTPMFRNEEDRLFAIRLLHRSILEHDENTALINRQIQNWDVDRIALIDLYIMQIALSEIKNFPLIPVNVSLNEYVDLAHYYSTPKSSMFINGLLDGIVTELRNEQKLLKN
jgi:N utilization substance protein B